MNACPLFRRFLNNPARLTGSARWRASICCRTTLAIRCFSQRGRGCYVFDASGKRYLDLLTGIGVNSLGHAHPRLTKVIREQAGLLLHTSNLYYHEYQGPLAERLAKVSGLQRTFFCNSGAETMEGALKMIRSHGRKIHPDKYETVALQNSFHGRTFGALSITGQEKYRKDFEPMLPGARFVPHNDIVALEQTVNERTAGIVIEWIQGEGGIHPISDEFARKARELADRYDALLVFDEIQCGVGRTGSYFAYQTADPVVLPDIMVAAKPLACGIPLGVIVANETRARNPSAPACTDPRLAADRWRAAWPSNSWTFWKDCCRTSNRWARTSA